MANQALLARKEQFEREVAAYSGEDPLKPWYEYLSWLDAQFGKDKILDTFTSTLESALNAHWNVQKYKDDARLIELQMIYASLQGDPLKLYKSYYDRGIATQSAILYINWANHFAAAGEYRRADEIFKLGCEKTSPDLKHDLSSAFEKFLATVGRRFLDGEIKDNSCTKCGTPPETVVKEILMNPGPPGNWDDFTTLVAVFEEPNPKNVPMYPKNKVYREAGKEYSLEELLAEEYFAKERQKNEKGTMQQPLLVTTPKSSGSNMGVPLGAEAAMRSSCFPEPLLPKSKEESISTQSFTSRTKMAMNFIQEMWSSPSPCVDPPRVENHENRPSVLPRTEEKARTPFPIYVDENPETPKAAERKPLTPFNVFNDNDNEDVGDPPPTHIGTRASTAKKTLTQPKPNVLSERKVPSTKLAEPPKPHAKQHLFEQPLFDFQNANDVLATKLSEASVSDPPTPFQPFGGIQPLFPAEQVVNDDETTCNTRAFNFALPSSTPLQQKKSLAPYHRIEQNQGNVLEEQPTYHTQQNLSVILEASKERCSSSGSCASQPRTPGIPGSSVPKQLMLEEGTEIDPFCPKIIDKLLKLINFPLPHHIEGYHSQNQALPSITKTLRLGNETFTTSGELGRGAYARVVKATNDKSTVALKVEKPACRWEYYIAKEIQRRVDPNVRLLFMDIRSAHIYNNGSILVTDWAKHGSLLNVINSYKQKTGVALEQNLAAHFALEVMRAVEHLHKAKIIHGDIKPDNFVIKCLPSSNEPGPSLMLIDFGRSIDMSLYPAGTKFHKVVTTDGFQCGEMREQKPWTYQTDLFGLAVTIFCLLAGDYMKVARKNGEWKPLKPLPRFLRREIWDPILHDLINVQSCEKLPNLSEHCKTVESWFNNDCNRYDKYAAYRHLCNILAGK